MKLLEGKVALITGAARGIGKAIALKFAQEGADIAFTDLVIDENGKKTEEEIAALGVKVKGYASNAANFEETHKVVEQIHADFGHIDVLVNNAGFGGKIVPVAEQTDEDIIRTPGMPYLKLKYLRSFVNVYHTPHMAFFTAEAAEQMAECGVNSIYEILTDGKSKHEIPC